MYSTEIARKSSSRASSARPAGVSPGRFARRAAAVALLLLGVAAQVQAQPVPLLGNGSLPASQLIVGDDLWVGLKGGDAGALYDFRLSGADGALISGAYATADAAGTVASTLVWKRSGVVGCDCGAGADPDDFRFQTYEQAEAALSGKTLVLQVLSASGVQLARVAVPAVAMRRELSYFSDAAGCPRQIFKAGEAIHLSFLHPDRSRGDRQVFIAQSRLWPIGEPIRDLRGAGQKMILPAAGERVTLPLSGLAQDRKSVV